ncbi:MAG TPA: ScbA/BarX family gamma-butyrolactone biosynthesis protein [Actinophytocola sp.]|uniref:ScbA/BarX family gamma-butyrolactone biosynthesis protein n=1 Tax=Actinophytocola sp. TaxID=1872138 RepID=UPI002F91DD98
MTTMINPDQGLSVRQDTAERLFQQPVPPRLVRRTHQSDVFVTNLRVTGVDRFEVSARLPAAHSFYGPVRPGLHDPLLLLEAVRESILLVGHFAYEIPREFKWITHTKQFHFDPAGLLNDGDAPVEVTILLSHHDIKRRGRRPAAMRTEVECYRAGVRIGTAEYDWSVVSGPAYKKLRGRYVDAEPAMPQDAAAVAPGQVGRMDEIDVLLAEWPDGPGWQVRVDPAHPVIYDHTVDHVPGNAVAEIVRQAALLATGRPDALPAGGDFSFLHYLEFDSPCVVSAKPVGTDSEGRIGVRFLVEQNDRRSVEGVLQLQFC